MKVIGIGGGSGSGKSTVAYALVDGDPTRFEILNFDDYQKLSTEPGLPKVGKLINWDHPDIINWKQLINDVRALKSGMPVTIQTKIHRSHIVYYRKHHERKARTILPHPILIVEGYLALYNPELNALYDHTFFLDLDDSVRAARRNQESDVTNEYYTNKIYLPMHHKYVEPSKANADTVIDVASMTVDQIAAKILQELCLL